MYFTLKNLRGEFRTILENRQSANPVDVEGIAEDLYIPIEDVEIKGDQHGELCRQSDGRFIIRIDQELSNSSSQNRRRFTIAHEIAHYMLHGHRLKERECIERGLKDGWEDYRESEANRLAADILMPHNLMETLINEGVNTIKGIANALEVSEQSLKIRLDMK